MANPAANEPQQQTEPPFRLVHWVFGGEITGAASDFSQGFIGVFFFETCGHV